MESGVVRRTQSILRSSFSVFLVMEEEDRLEGTTLANFTCFGDTAVYLIVWLLLDWS